MSVSLQRKEDFDSFVEREFEINNLQVELTNNLLLEVILKVVFDLFVT